MVRAYLFLALFIPLTFVLSGLALISTFFESTGRNYAWFARLWARSGLALSRVRVTIEGVENLPPEPVIFMSNHQSNFDILSLLAVLPHQIHWIAKKELFEIPVFGPSMQRGGYIPLDRGDGRKALKSMDNAAVMIRDGKSVVMFPEGTRSTDCKLLPFKRGGFILARKANVPVIPVTINGSGRVNPANRIELNPGNIRITLHPPLIVPSEMRKSAAEEWMLEQVRTTIEAKLEH